MKIAIWVGGISAAVALACFACVVWSNGSSRNLVLSAGALAGTVMLTLVQLPFELTQKTTEESFAIKILLDRSLPTIWILNKGSSGGSVRINAKDGPGAFIGKTNPQLFGMNWEKLARELTILSILGYIFSEKFDWQMKKATWVDERGTLESLIISTSRPDECTLISRDKIVDELIRSGNPFAGAAKKFLDDRQICLPPNSQVEISNGTLNLTNPFCQISFTFDLQASVMNTSPEREEKILGIRGKITYFSLRAQHVEMPKYELWTKDIVNGLKSWYGTP